MCRRCEVFLHTLVWNTSQLIDLAKVAGGTPTEAFTQCVTKGSYDDWAQSIDDAATASKVKGTPTMFLNYLPVEDLLEPAFDGAALRARIQQAAGR